MKGKGLPGRPASGRSIPQNARPTGGTSKPVKRTPQPPVPITFDFEGVKVEGVLKGTPNGTAYAEGKLPNGTTVKIAL